MTTNPSTQDDDLMILKEIVAEVEKGQEQIVALIDESPMEDFGIRLGRFDFGVCVRAGTALKPGDPRPSGTDIVKAMREMASTYVDKASREQIDITDYHYPLWTGHLDDPFHDATMLVDVDEARVSFELRYGSDKE